MDRPPPATARVAASDDHELPMLQRRLFAPYKMATLVDAAATHGIDAEVTLRATEMDARSVRDPHALTSVRDYLTACQNVLAAGAPASLAFDVGGRLHMSAYGMYGYALMCAPTMRDFCDFAVHYQPLATPMLRLGWRCERGRAIWRFGAIYDPVLAPEARAFLVRQQMMMTATHVRDVAGVDARPLAAFFALPSTYAAPEDESALSCVCVFDAAAHELHYDAALFEREPRFANRLNFAWLRETCDEMLAVVTAATGLTGEIHQLLMRSTEGVPTMAAIAARLRMTERTLRRRLEGEGTRFADLVDDARRRKALHLIETSTMTADAIAVRLSFSDTANFRRAIKRWTGSTFVQLRAEPHLADDQPSTKAQA